MLFLPTLLTLLQQEKDTDMKSPVETFSNWVRNGKDDGMEKNHFESVSKMFKLIINSKEKFSLIDAGCGNGWAVRYISKHPNCKFAFGVDGSEMMIEKAKKLDSNNEYFIGDLLKWKPKNKVDAVISMEVMYYFENPIIVLKNIFNNWLNQEGRFVMGIDFYYENPDCHDWQEKTGVTIMNLMKIKEWERLFIETGFGKVKKYQFCKSGHWKGTLVLEGIKINN